MPPPHWLVMRERLPCSSHGGLNLGPGMSAVQNDCHAVPHDLTGNAGVWACSSKPRLLQLSLHPTCSLAPPPAKAWCMYSWPNSRLRLRRALVMLVLYRPLPGRGWQSCTAVAHN